MAKKPYRTCPRDGYPLVKINGRWECVAEYLDRCIGQKTVVDVVRKENTTYYVFENGHELPLLCFCCDSPLIVENIEETRRDMKGRRLDGLRVVQVELKDGTEMPQLHLLFSKKSLLGDGMYDAVSLQVAAQMRHPPNCPYSSGSAAARNRRRQRRKRPQQKDD
ncbi:MAG: hypothetical protein ISS49_03845 [Anaerolineae bacterium]|nr:hypothetical protein [Anaerolineae bacterium]